MNKHTPGPWTVGISADDNPIHCIDAFDATKGHGILEVCKVWGTVCDTEETVESAANARLIACAPDLLTDLTEAAATLRHYETLHRAKDTEDSTAKANVNAALAARFESTIAKARGAV